MVSTPHPWKLVGPWYRWEHAAVPRDGRKSAPALQKFAGADFIAGFLEQPQHSLRYDETDDVVSNLDFVKAVPGGALLNKVATLFPVDASGNPTKSKTDAYRSRLAPSDLRKLYLPVHDRHYLVTCELHCDVPGFPSVPRKEVCQAGFTVRRRSAVVPAGLEAQVAAQVRAVRVLEADYAELLTLDEAARLHSPAPGEAAAIAARQQALAKAAGAASWPALLAARRAGVAAQRKALQAWYAEHGVSVKTEGWFPDVVDGKPSKTLGRWVQLEGEARHADPEVKGESVFPLYALAPDPRDKAHDAAGRTMYYGAVPTSSLTHDTKGHPRFDDQATYEIWCFVRRHKPCCPRRQVKPDCKGEVVWAAPTEAYRLAPPFDLVGTSNRPITIKMPDLRELAAQAASRPRGRFSPVRVLQPQHLCAKVNDGVPVPCEPGGEAVCFFSIPLITIVALFVLNIFLPIVVLIFQLWFLLVFRFCIPPQISLGLGVDAALAAQPPGVDLDADLGIEVDGAEKTAAQINALLKTSLGVRIAEETGEDAGAIEGKLAGFSNGALGVLSQNMQDAALLPADPAQAPPDADAAGALDYEPHRDREWSAESGSRL
jgi:hypothetical protein